MSETTPTIERLHHQFDDAEQQRVAYSLGMWIFLATEVLFFGGMFMLFSMYYIQHTGAFHAASHHMEIWAGTINTGVLLCSSLTMALAIWNADHGRRRAATKLFLATMGLGTLFLMIKAVEYTLHFRHHLWPGGAGHFEFEEAHRASAQIFFALYFTMTGLHAVHMIIGVGVVALMTWWTAQGRYPEGHIEPLEMTGLYWHFVDIVWIFLFPLFYLIGRTS